MVSFLNSEGGGFGDGGGECAGQEESARVATHLCDTPAQSQCRYASHTGVDGARIIEYDATLYTQQYNQIAGGVRKGASA